ncbi:MAG: hypothetical protein ACI915_005415 [Gammaproteobacteria bacterium]
MTLAILTKRIRSANPFSPLTEFYTTRTVDSRGISSGCVTRGRDVTKKTASSQAQFAVFALWCIVFLSNFTTTSSAANRPLPNGPLTAEISAAIEICFGANLGKQQWGQAQTDALQVIVQSKDPRLVWMITDLMRVATDYQFSIVLGMAASQLLEVDFDGANAWHSLTNLLTARDIPAPLAI